MERIIETVKFGGVSELRQRLNELVDLLPPGAFRTCGVEQSDARDLRAFEIVERVLSDRSKAYDIRLIPWVAPLHPPIGVVPAGSTVRVSIYCPDCEALKCEKHREVKP